LSYLGGPKMDIPHEPTSVIVAEAQQKLPMIRLRGVVIFPHMTAPFVDDRESSLRALAAALAADNKIFLATQHDASVEQPKANEVYQVGTIVNILHSLKLPDGRTKLLVEGLERGKILAVTGAEGYFQASVRTVKYSTEVTPPIEAGILRVKGLFEQYLNLCLSVNYEPMIAALPTDAAQLSDTVAANLLLPIEEKQELLEIFDPAERLHCISDLLDIAIEKQRMDALRSSGEIVASARTMPSVSAPEAEPAQEPISIIVADAHAMAPDYVAKLKQRAEFEVVGCAVTVNELFELLLELSLKRRKAPVALIGAPLRNEHAVLQYLRQKDDIRLILMADQPLEAELVAKAFRAGTRGIFNRYESQFEDLCKCISCVHSGQIWVTPEQLQAVVDALARSSPIVPVLNQS